MIKKLLTAITLTLATLTTSCSSNNQDDKIIEPTEKKIIILDKYTISHGQINNITSTKTSTYKSENYLSYNDKGLIKNRETFNEYFDNTNTLIKKNYYIEFVYDNQNRLVDVLDFPYGKNNDFYHNPVTYNNNGLPNEGTWGVTGHYFTYNQDKILVSKITKNILYKYKSDKQGNITSIIVHDKTIDTLTYDTYNSPFKDLPFNNTFEIDDLQFVYKEQNNVVTRNNYNITYKYNADGYPYESSEVLNTSHNNSTSYRIIQYYYKTITIKSI